ncbi:hypothetical protein F2Q68_00044165 [Brassica cretica]|uniref:Uncharacterized protein n=1 Tax=Brassica cretica TaxID=69181 RepID=A0A8S9LRS4_BRACR|nr:hypothetical protein F2Q68_00044165 [Brassica cretica]
MQPKHADRHVCAAVAPCMSSSHALTSGRGGGVLHMSWTCSQPCGARGAAAHASGAMQSDTRASTNLKLIGQFSIDFESTPKEGYVQMNSSRPISSFDDQVEVLSRVSSAPRIQMSRSSARYSAEKFEELSRS